MNSINEAKFTFSLRTRMLEIKANYENKHENKLCVACNKTSETQEHLLLCAKLWDSNVVTDTLPVYSDILGTNAENILKISRLIKSAFEERKLLMKK